MNETQKEMICEKYCKFPYECENQEELDNICSTCPLNFDDNENEKLTTEQRKE